MHGASKPHVRLQSGKTKKEERESRKRRWGRRNPKVSVGREGQNGLPTTALEKGGCCGW